MVTKRYNNAAQVVIEKLPGMRYGDDRYVAAQKPSNVDWPAKLELLRTGDFAEEAGRSNAVRLLKGCGYDPVVGGVKARWTREHITPELLDRIQTLQRAVRGLFRTVAVREAASYRAAYKRTIAPAIVAAPRDAESCKPAARGGDLAAAMEKYLKSERADLPPKPADVRAKNEYLSELFRCVADAAKARGEEFRQVMQRIAPGKGLGAIKFPALPPPEAVLRNLLDFHVIDGIVTRFTFNEDGAPVVILTPLDPIAALLLRAHEATSLRAVVHAEWVVCEWCGKPFPKKRSAQRGCPGKCANNLKVSRYRRTKQQQA